jgi:uncharacterized protein YdaU (DUF1376 family)
MTASIRTNERAKSFLFWVPDFLADPAVAAMGPEEVGGYMLLLCYAWQSDDRGVLDNNDEMLARLTRLNDRWPKHKAAILRAFVVRDGKLIQKRMVREAKATDERINRAKENGRSAAQARWSKDLNATRIRETCEPNTINRNINNEEPRIAVEAVNQVTPGDIRSLLGEVVESVSERPAPVKRIVEHPTETVYKWLQDNATADQTKEAMRFVGWLMKTGTRDSETLLALTKHFVVYKPKNPHAYFTKEGSARTAIAMRTAADAAIREHERVLAEEREFLRRSL